MKLYWCENTRAFRIIWMLDELGQPYERIRVDVRGGETGENKSDPDFRAASPMGKVPALVDGPVKLWDSGAICLYLADKYPEAGLSVAADDPRRGEFLQWLMFTNAVIEPAMLEKFMELPPKPQSYGHGSFESMIGALEKGLKGRDWLMGDRFTAADVLVGSSVHVLQQFGLLPVITALQGYVARCRIRPGLQKALALDGVTKK
ncbi:MAG: glutathione S-transferase family protein [Alphaproteobacteria bacterium]|nr:glutathione S-transferase family protein [Alphaproteobacteria bacterium]